MEREESRAKSWLDPIRFENSRGFRPAEIRQIERLVAENAGGFWRHGVSTSEIERREATAQSLRVSDDTLTVDLADARTITVPLAWFPRLANGTALERANWRLIGNGEGVHWADLDEDISVQSLLAGRGSGETQASLRRWLQGRKSVA